MMVILWHKIKKILKILLPEFILNMLWKVPIIFNVTSAYIHFVFSKKITQKLTWEELDSLQKEYYNPLKRRTMEYRMELAKRRVQILLTLLPKGIKLNSLLETGAGHGLFSIIAQREFNIKTTAIDLEIKQNSELEKAEISFEVMDVAKMSFDDNTFDCVVSFDAFEHFMEPEKALAEMIRVTKPKGFILLNFGPIYYSAWGLHIYNCIYVPYSQYLFDYKTMKVYLEKNDLEKIKPQTLNQWDMIQYNQLWKSFSDHVDIIHKKVTNNYRELKLVRKYPSLFKSQTKRFQDLCNSHITILFQKKSPD